jgi:hypothetical protein
MGGWSPWRTLRERDHIDLVWRDLPRDVAGYWSPRRGGRAVIVLASWLHRRARRCTLAHELVHDERGLVTSGMPPALAAKEEHAVEREVARRLVPPEELVDLVRRAVELGDGVTVHDVAEAFDVDDDVARRALEDLRARAR